MYGKLFEAMYDGTLAEDWRALITFQQMIILCDADGVVDMTPSAISRRTGIPIDHIKAGIEILESPDPYSRTDTDDGCRIQLIDAHRPWGWYITNHSKYRALQDAETVRAQTRERVRRHRAKSTDVTVCNAHVTDVTDGNGQKRHTDTDTDTDTDTKDKRGLKPPPARDQVVAYFVEKGSDEATADHFIDHYTSNGWKVSGKTPMKDWKAAARNWLRRRDEYGGTNSKQSLEERLLDTSWLPE